MLKNRNGFIVGRVERNVAPPVLLSEKLYDVVSQYDDIVLGFQSDKQEFSSFSVTRNWVKRSILWELLYWKTNFLRHNLDVIQIEKNVFEDIFIMVMDAKGKTKDNIKAVMNILFFHRKKYEVGLWWVMVRKAQSQLRLREECTITCLQIA